MPLETKHINLLRSCSMYLKTRGNTHHAKVVHWDHMMQEYSKDLEEIAQELEKLNLPETVVNLADLFKGENDA